MNNFGANYLNNKFFSKKSTIVLRKNIPPVYSLWVLLLNIQNLFSSTGTRNRKENDNTTSIDFKTTMYKNTFDKHEKNQPSIQILEKQIVNLMWNKFGGVASAPDLSIYLENISPMNVYRILEGLKNRKVIRETSDEYIGLREQSKWYQNVYELNI